MKKTTIAILLALVMSLSTAALAEPIATLKSSQEFIIDKGNGKYQVLFYAEYENTGDEPMGSSEVLVDLTDGDGNIYTTIKANSITPFNIQPGGIGFTSRQETLKDVTDASLFSSYSITATAKKGAVQDMVFPAECTLVTERRDGFIRASVEFVITNDRDEIYMWPSIHFGIYDQNDQIMYAGSVQAADAGIIPGNQVLLKSNVSDEVCRAWATKDLVPTSVKFICTTSRKK